MPPDSSQSQANDQELQFKKRARRRLVGAVALVLVMVVLLPMVLDDRSANAPQQAVKISIPSQDDAEFVSQAPPKALSPVRETPVTSQPDPVESPPQAENETPVASPQTKPQENRSQQTKSQETKSQENRSQENRSQEAKPAQIKPQEQKKPPEVKSTDTRKTDAVKKPVEKPKSDEAVNKAAESKAQPGETTSNNDSDKPYYLQIGVFSDTVNVKQLEQKLIELKLKPYTEKISTDKGDKTRLRVGPFERKEQADSAANKVKTIGLAGFVSNK